MEYKIEKNKITFLKNDDFDAKSILECGQMFRYYKIDGGYEVITGKHLAKVMEDGEKVEIITSEPEVFVRFFDLDEDYSRIKKELSKYEFLRGAIEHGKGIRIARGEPEEVIFFFVISQNNNIKRIQKIIEKMSEIGEPIDEKHKAFPKAKVLAKKPMEYFKSLGAGYRDVFLFETAKVLGETDLEKIAALPDDELYKWLLSIKGVGPKVASCIMLFGFHRTSCFPVDTWIEKVYRQYFFVGEKTRPQISQYLSKKFGAMSGIVQQYLFYNIRPESKDKH